MRYENDNKYGYGLEKLMMVRLAEIPLVLTL
jgi:hypothetical protein